MEEQDRKIVSVFENDENPYDELAKLIIEDFSMDLKYLEVLGKYAKGLVEESLLFQKHIKEKEKQEKELQINRDDNKDSIIREQEMEIKNLRELLTKTYHKRVIELKNIEEKVKDYEARIQRLRSELLEKGISYDVPFRNQIFPFVEELTDELVKDTKKLIAGNTTSDIHLIDLGLPSGTLWADRNLGAEAPEKAGDYYRFGEYVPFTEDSPEYVFDKIEESIAGTDRDAATVNLGKNYKMPTDEQFKEILDECKWKWTEINGSKGMKVTGPNGNIIFLPASGILYRSGVVRYGGDPVYPLYPALGYYWSASPRYIPESYLLHFSDKKKSCTGAVRFEAFPVRAVAEKRL